MLLDGFTLRGSLRFQALVLLIGTSMVKPLMTPAP